MHKYSTQFCALPSNHRSLNFDIRLKINDGHIKIARMLFCIHVETSVFIHFLHFYSNIILIGQHTYIRSQETINQSQENSNIVKKIKLCSFFINY